MKEQFEILLADDTEDDVTSMRQAMRNARLKDRLHVVQDGDQAVGYLNGAGPFSPRTILIEKWALGSVLFPNSSPSRRRRKMRMLLIWLAAGTVLAAAVASFLLFVEKTWHK